MKLAIGTVQFGIKYGVRTINKQVKFNEVKKILDYAYSKNISFIDTAAGYGNSEKILGKTDISNFSIVTKTRYFNNFEITNNDVELMDKDFFESLKNLKKTSIYSLMIHNSSDLLKVGGGKLFNHLSKLKSDKKIIKIGVSIYDHNILQSIINNFDIDLVQLPFNIFDRKAINNGLFTLLKKHKIEIHVRSVFLKGLLLMTKENRPKKFNRWNNLWEIWHQWLNDNKITAIEASIRFANSVPEISKVLVGIETKNQLQQIINACKKDYLPKLPKELYTDDIDLINPSNWEKL